MFSLVVLVLVPQYIKGTLSSDYQVQTGTSKKKVGQNNFEMSSKLVLWLPT